MVAAKRITKKQLKQPDEFVTWGSRAMNYLVARINYIGLGLLVLGVIVLAVFLWRQHVAATQERAFTLLGKGISLYEQDDKDDDAAQAFTTLIDDYGRTRAGKMALLYRGRLYMHQSKYDQAIADYKLLLQKSSVPFLRAVAYNGLGTAHMAKGEYREGIKYFQDVLSSDAEWLKPFARLRIGMCWEFSGERKKASEAYRESLKSPPPPPWANWARLRLKKLEEATE